LSPAMAGKAPSRATAIMTFGSIGNRLRCV
jgi:hypothetical protein